MKLRSFRIRNFRSIVDSGWCNLSDDNISGLIGQNESGKTSILDALYSFYTGKISPDDIRSDYTLPEVSCSFKTQAINIRKLIECLSLPNELVEKFSEKENRINITREWQDVDSSNLFLDEKDIADFF